MKHFEIIVDNGRCPLTYKCTTAAEAFECITTLTSWASHIRIDEDEIMRILINMKFNGHRMYKQHGFTISYEEGEV